MTYLIKIGFGGENDWDGFTNITVDKKSFDRLKQLPEQFDDDKFELNTTNEYYELAGFLIEAKFEHLCLVEFESAALTSRGWGLVPDQKPYQDVHCILIWNKTFKP